MFQSIYTVTNEDKMNSVSLMTTSQGCDALVVISSAAK